MTLRKPSPGRKEKRNDEKSNLFINPNGVLCYTVEIYKQKLFTMIDVQPYLFDKRGCIEDWRYKHI